MEPGSVCRFARALCEIEKSRRVFIVQLVALELRKLHPQRLQHDKRQAKWNQQKLNQYPIQTTEVDDDADNEQEKNGGSDQKDVPQRGEQCNTQLVSAWTLVRIVLQFIDES